MFNNARYYILIFSALLFQNGALAQGSSLASFLSQVEDKYSITFNYVVEDIEGIFITEVQEFSSFSLTLEYLRRSTPFLYRKVSEKVITLLPSKNTSFCGYLRDKETDQIIEGATISVATINTITDADGYFEIPQQENDNITINRLGYATVIVDTTVSTQSGCQTVYMFQEPIALGTIELSSYLVKGINKLSDGSFQIDFNDFSLLPGLIETDVLQAAQALPGIQSIDETVSDINIRGGSNDQNLLLWDDIKMYQSGHFFGLISAFNPNITQRVSVKKNGTEALYTDGVSGTISMQTDKKVAQHTIGSIGASLLSADGFVDVALSKKSSIQFALRHSINGIFQTPTYDSYFERISQETEVFDNEENIINSNQNFNFYDGSLRWLYNIGEKDKLRLNFLIVGNDLSFTETATTTFFESRNSSLAQNSVSGGIYYEHTWNSRSKTHLQFYETDYILKAINANVLNNQRLLQENIVSESSVRLQHDLKTSKQWQFSGGYHLIESGITNLDDVDNPLFRERITEVVRSHAVFGQSYFNTLSEKTKLSLGLRVDYIEKFKRTLIEPRFTLSHRLLSGVTVQALAEFKHQNTSQIVSLQNDFLGIEKRRWQLANDQDIPIIQSKQASVGLSYKKKGWLIDATGYYKNVNGITTQSQGFETKYEFVKTSGNYNVAGIDVLIRKNIDALSTWLSYGYMDNQYTFEALDEVNFPSNFDISHALTLGATYQHRKWKISSGVNWHKGQPTTKPNINNEILAGAVNFGRANSDRLSDYIRVDVSTTFNLITTDNTRLESGVSIWNVVNNRNTVGTFYRVINGDVTPFEENALSTTVNTMLRFHF